jgi:hypothetical protein
MLNAKLFESVLVDPVSKGANRLYVVSGYATAAMGLRHLEAILPVDKGVKVHLIVGMCPQDGIAESNHKAFQQLTRDRFPENFECSYVFAPPAVHSKVYAWFRGDRPECAFVGSANYSQNAFLSGQQLEAMEGGDPKECRAYFDSLTPKSIYCTDDDVSDSVRIVSDLEYARRRAGAKTGVKTKAMEEPAGLYAGLPAVSISLLDRKGELPGISGLNWGQRKGREPNQAYIRIPSMIGRLGFFPERAAHFTVLTDDGKVLICTRAQDQGKAIETPHGNSQLGEYFRNRLGLANGRKIHKEDLVAYGRSDVKFIKIDDETYFMDFSVQK